MKHLCYALVTLLVAACAGDVEIYRFASQKWNNVNVVIEARPGSASSEMYEFLVIASFDNHTPAHDLMVLMRVDEQEPWKQAIQDGYVGVYRRAYKVHNLDQDVLYVQLQRGQEQGVLQFALKDRAKTTP